ncbi:MAG: hypothetical protein ACYDEF_15345 [Methanosarcina sp.]|nr:hypothetical protein BGV40_16225 [Methanosarcina sp. Ant1]
MNKQQVKNAVRRFSDLIERNKDLQAYSDFKEGMNEGLEIAKDTFEENAEKFVLSDSEEDRVTKIKSLQDSFDLLIDRLVIKKKPKYSQDSLDGINKGLERSKELFRDFIEEFL